MKRSLLCLCLFVDIVYRVAADEWHCQDCRHIDAIKARILNQLGLPTSAYASYDIVWPIKPSRIKRTFSDDPFYPEPEHLMSIRIFGQRLTTHLKLSNITSSSVLPSPQCFFRGSVETCEKGQCSTGKAAVSDCSDTGLFGYFQVNDEGFALSPLPSSIAFSMREASGAHLAKLIEPLEMWDDLHENHIYVRETFPMNRVNNYFLPNFEYSPLLRTFVLPFHPSTYTTPDIELNSTDTGKISVTLRIFIDKFMVDILSKKYGNDASEQLTSVLSAINAVQAIYDDTSLGPVQVLLSVTEVVFDRSPEAQGMQLGDGDAEKYLVAFCDGQDSILTAEADITVALTGLDLYGLLNNINKDKVYSSLVFRSNRIYGVTGLSYTGGACRRNRNCMVIEFRKEMENVATIAHELGHVLGMDHDGTDNDCDSFAGKIMSLSVVRQRSGWSKCSAKSFHDFLRKKGSCLLDVNQSVSQKKSQ